jgi:glycosyltransferase involved in cell wall biosynthesis
MRVALVTNNHLPPREGIGRHVIELAKRLPAQGIKPFVLAKGRSMRAWERLTVEGVPVALYPYAPVRPFHQEAIRAVLQPWLDRGAEGADLLHLHLPLLPRLRTGLPRLVTFHSPMLSDTAAITEKGLRPALIKTNARLFSQAYEHAHIRAAGRLIAVSENVKSELLRSYRLGGQVPDVVANGVDTEAFSCRTEPVHATTVLYAGRLGYRKGLCRLLEALALIERSDVVLELAGEGPLQADLANRAAALGIADRVRFLGFLDRTGLQAAHRRAGVFVNPADYEACPLSLLEAMAMGTPIVTTPVGFVGQLPEPRPLTVVEADPAPIAIAIEAVLAAPAAMHARAIRARRLVEAHFSWDRVAAIVAAAYRGLARTAA